MKEENRKYIESLEREIEGMEKETVEKVRDRLSYDTLSLTSHIAWIEKFMQKRERAISYFRKLLAEARTIAGN